MRSMSMKWVALCLTLLSTLAFGVEFKQDWNDTVRVCIIWNEGTGSDGMPKDWQQADGEIGDSSRAFVASAIESVPSKNIKTFSGQSVPQDLNALKNEFSGELPHVIVYINAGYTWDQHAKNPTPRPKALLTSAADAGVGIVAIGDDAAIDGKDIFPLKGPGGKGDPIQIQGYTDAQLPVTGGLSWPYMQDAIYMNPADNYATPLKGYENLLIWLDPVANKGLPDKGLLWGVKTDTLRFKKWEKGGRGQADADMWELDPTAKLDVKAMIGFQTANYKENGATYKIPNKTENQKSFKAISALQNDLNRVVMLGYQPQYLEDEDASKQIIYNSLYWASKAHEMLKIEKPTATPDKGNPATVGDIELTIDFPSDPSLYEIWFSIDGGTWEKYSGKFPLPQTGNDVKLMAVGRATKPADWFDSDTLKVTYEYVGGPVLDSARLTPGTLDKQTSQRGKDLLKVYFNKDMKDIAVDKPFLSEDKDGNSYVFTLNKDSQSGNSATFTVSSINGKPADYLPKDREDRISIDPAANLEDSKGAKQDGSNNVKVPLFVDEFRKEKIATPEADPSSGNTQSVSKVKLSVAYPTDKVHYTIRFAINGDVSESSQEYTGEFDLPKSTGDNMVIKAVAYSNSKDIWLDSDTMTVTYDYVGGPVLDSVFIHPGDYNNSSFDADTLVVKFTKDIESFQSIPKPFLFSDRDGKSYEFELKYLERAGRWARFEIVNNSYLPESEKDSAKIDVNANVKATDGTVQDDPNNRKVPIIVKERKLPRIDTPKTDDRGNTQQISDVKIRVERPDEKYFTIYYTTDGSDVSRSSEKLADDGVLTLPDNGDKDVVLKVVAISDSTHLWQTSDTLIVTYEYVAPPVIDSAIYAPGKMTNFETSEMAPDTLYIYFDQDVDENSSPTPFDSKDENGNSYTFSLKDLNDKGSKHSYLIDGVSGKPDGYLPENMKDAITINTSVKITATESQVYQDGSNNRTVPLIVRDAPSNVQITSIWFDKETMPDLAKEVIEKFSPAKEGSLILIDPQARLNESEWDKYSASMAVFDVLGNQVISLASLESNGESIESAQVVINGRTQFAVLWSAKNEKRRRVGTGAYVAVVSVTDNNGKETVQKHMLKVPARKK